MGKGVENERSNGPWHAWRVQLSYRVQPERSQKDNQKRRDKLSIENPELRSIWWREQVGRIFHAAVVFFVVGLTEHTLPIARMDLQLDFMQFTCNFQTATYKGRFPIFDHASVLF